jgi:hypothetical protein
MELYEQFQCKNSPRPRSADRHRCFRKRRRNNHEQVNSKNVKAIHALSTSIAYQKCCCMERYEHFLPSPRPVAVGLSGPFVKQGIGAILRLAIRSIGRCTLKRLVGNYRYNRTASPDSTRLVEQLTFVADGTNGSFQTGFSAVAWKAYGRMRCTR